MKRAKSGETVGAVARELGLVEQTLRNWVKAAKAGKLHAPGAKTRDAGAIGVVAGPSRECAAANGGRNIENSDGVLRKRCAVKYAWIEGATRRVSAAGDVSDAGSGQQWLSGAAPCRPDERPPGEQRTTAGGGPGPARGDSKEPTARSGWLRISARRGFPASKERIQRLLRENGIWARHKRRYKATTDYQAWVAGGAELLDRTSRPRPNRSGRPI